MKKALYSFVIGGTALLSACANMGGGSGPVAVSETVALDAPAAEVWSLVGEFNDMERWHPAVKISKQLAEYRHLILQDDSVIVEEETGRDDAAMTYSYKILSGPLPVSNYQSTITVTAISANKSSVTWSSTFTPESADAAGTIRDVYQAGLDKLDMMY